MQLQFVNFFFDILYLISSFGHFLHSGHHPYLYLLKISIILSPNVEYSCSVLMLGSQGNGSITFGDVKKDFIFPGAVSF